MHIWFKDHSLKIGLSFAKFRFQNTGMKLDNLLKLFLVSMFVSNFKIMMNFHEKYFSLVHSIEKKNYLHIFIILRFVDF